MRAKIKKKKWESLHILADFDRTLTYGKGNNEKKSPSIISLLRDGDYLDVDYRKKAHKLHDKYYPIEVDPSATREEKKEAMQAWWEEHYELLVNKGLSKQDYKQILDEGKIKFRKGVRKFLGYLSKKEVPVVVISASGTGEAIPMFFEKHGVNYSNTHFIINRFEWNDKGVAVDYKRPIIHSMNKDETVLSEFPDIHKEIKDRTDVILLGDTEGDVDMVTGFDYGNLLKIGFLGYKKTDARRKKFEQVYDVVLEGDGDFEFINTLFGI